jgi:hypothetical protein
MLQIISGKFFRSDDRYIHDGKAIAYSNYSWIKPIETSIASLEPVETYIPVSSYVICYKNQIEKERMPNLLRIGDTEIAHQFRLLCTFGFRAFFDIDRNRVETYCRTMPLSAGDTVLPSIFVPRFFDSRIDGKKGEIDYFVRFVEKIIGLQREKYLVVIKCLENLSNSLQILNNNLDLAYSMLIYSLETLSQTFDDFSPSWEDYYQDIRGKLDKILMDVDDNYSDEIRRILLSSAILRLRQRFIAFVEDNLDDNYFTVESKDVKFALRKSELNRALKNSYSMRSGFVHQLVPIQKHLKISQIAGGDTFKWKHEPYFTYRGLLRLTLHVINSFIWRQDSYEHEDYDWTQDLPGRILMQKAPQYWITETEGFSPDQATKRLSGFLQNLQEALVSGAPLADIRDLLQEIEMLAPNAKKEEKLAMLTIYHLFHQYIEDEAKRPNHELFLERYVDILADCCIENMIGRFMSRQDWPWEIEECVPAFHNYMNNKFKEKSIEVPVLIEIAIMLHIANIYMLLGDFEICNEWLNGAILEAAGRPDIQNRIEEIGEGKKPVDPFFLFSIKPQENQS